MHKFVFITGGVVSALGKGVAASGIAALLQLHGFRVRLKKLDPYLNIDSGTMNPYQHGEVFVTADGCETDLDLGYYERFTGNNATADDAVTSGKLYEKLLKNERQGRYGGGTVQTIPHFTDLIKDFITAGQEDCDFMICEIGGTVGDIEAFPYLEAVRQIRHAMGLERSISIHLTLLPYVVTAGELKTKPTQHSVKELRAVGIQPDVIICRADRAIPADLLRKVSLYCGVQEQNVIEAPDLGTIYQVPIAYHEAQVDKRIMEHFKLQVQGSVDLSRWRNVVDCLNKRSQKKRVQVAIVGKYQKLRDSYKSLLEAFVHAELHSEYMVDAQLIDADEVEKVGASALLAQFDGIVIPGGFGERGIIGKMKAIAYARETHKPILGICLGMQLMAIEFARNVLGIANANSTEFSSDCVNIVDLMVNWMSDGRVEIRGEDSDLGGTMRLGTYQSTLVQGSAIAGIYGTNSIKERHRHRFEFNSQYRDRFEAKGMRIGAVSENESLVESVELQGHPWFIGVQFHPEYKSKPFEPHPLFISFVMAAAR